ncbi:MAG TPA: NAD(P)H-hydrate epimerase, partial [Trueperaceae bacterium]|nr:NAD(P)H-hydrate epimerase [Trueperaceae bacterium]
MKLYRAAELRAADSAAAAAGISTWRLMEAAGGAVARLVAARYPDVWRATVLCGKGNNGGDGYVCARQLAASGWDVKVLELTAEPGTPDARRARADLVGAGSAAPLDAGTNLGEAGVIVDALFGSGLNRPVEGWLGELLARLHEHDAP